MLQSQYHHHTSENTSLPISTLPICNGWYVTRQKTWIELKESLKFHDAYGNVIFRLNPKWKTLSGRLVITDSNDWEIGYVRRKRRSMCLFASDVRTTYYFGNQYNDNVGAVKPNGTSACPSKCCADIYFGDTWIGETMGNWFTKSVKIYIGGMQAAEVLRSAASADGGFSIVTAAGVDASLVFMVVVALGEIHGWADNFNGGVCSNVLSKDLPYSSRGRSSMFRPQYGGRLGYETRNTFCGHNADS